MRLACVWPLLIGLGTLRAIEAHPAPLTADPPVKIPRRAVRALVGRSLPIICWDRALERQAARARPVIR
jgi:hypothetical protein